MKNKPVDTLTLPNRYFISSLTFLSQVRARTMTRDATTINHDDNARLQPSPALRHSPVAWTPYRLDPTDLACNGP